MKKEAESTKSRKLKLPPMLKSRLENAKSGKGLTSLARHVDYQISHTDYYVDRG